MYKFTEDDAEIYVRIKKNICMVSSKGFHYSRIMVDLITKVTKVFPAKFLILGSGIGWQTAYLSLNLQLLDPFKDLDYEIYSVDSSLEMIARTPKHIVNNPKIHIIHKTATAFIRGNGDEFGAIIYDMYKTTEKIVRLRDDLLNKMNKSTHYLILNIITPEDFAWILSKKLKRFVCISGETFGPYSGEIKKKIAWGGNKVVTFSDQDLFALLPSRENTIIDQEKQLLRTTDGEFLPLNICELTH